MTYAEVLDLMENRVLALGQSFWHYTADGINEYRGTFPCTVFLPPPSSIVFRSPTGPDVMAAVAVYDIQLAFMDLISPSAKRLEKIQVVQEQFQLAYDFVAQLVSNFQVFSDQETSRISTNPRIEPFFTFPWNSQHTAGVLLSFSYETTPTWDCSSLDEANGLQEELATELFS